MINDKSYRFYLENLKNMIFKILPLYEEESETFDEYLDSVIFELSNLKDVVSEHPHDIWYVRTCTKIKGIKDNTSRFSDKKIVKREVFNSLSLIDKQLKELDRRDGNE